MRKNGKTETGTTHCTCGKPSVVVLEGVPLCRDCVEEYDNPKTASLEPNTNDRE